METGSPRARVLLDVDGVLNPAVRYRGYRRFRCSPNGVTYKLWLNPGHGPALRKLAAETQAELVWASYWCDQANEWISPRIGLPSLPFVPIPDPPLDGGVSLGGWKVLKVAEWAGPVPFVWFEDEFDVPELLAEAAAGSGLGEHLLIPVDPFAGLTEEHLTEAREWLSALAAG